MGLPEFAGGPRRISGFAGCVYHCQYFFHLYYFSNFILSLSLIVYVITWFHHAEGANRLSQAPLLKLLFLELWWLKYTGKMVNA